ncbi:MAG TPA: sulfatase [Bryobacteraceae bacterium]|nr:sulfatase [Bryobacteraceae bacterium]
MQAKPNIILISADSLRANHLGCYGYKLPTSPNIDAFACQGTLFEKTFAPAIPTQPSHTTIFTGQHAITHGIVAHGGKAKLGRSTPFLPEILFGEGYTTVAVDTLFRERIWFGRGWEYIIDPSLHHLFYASVTQEELNDRAIHWMKTVPSRPFFMFIHYWDVHYPYVPPDRMRGLFYKGGNPTDPNNHTLDEWWDHPVGAMARDTWLRTANGLITDPNYVTALYDREIRYLDDGIAALSDALEKLGIAENTIVILLADHGESMTDHRIFYDHYGLHDCVVQVPMIVRWPAGNVKAGARFAPFRQLSDVAPTLLEAAGCDVPDELDGKSFLPQLTGREEPSGYDRVIGLESTWQSKYYLRTDRYKFILARYPDLLGNPDRELFDLEADPDENHNIAAEQPQLAAELEKELEAFVAEKMEAAGRTEDPVRKEGPVAVEIWEQHRG